MKISTRILISLILSLIFLGACIIGIAYNNTQSNAKMFIKESHLQIQSPPSS